ncbi:P-loop containing nucleoside triphosphate hydrolase superfamily protein [Trifolium repens]|nr:P-loop containing nucleoside triphosphate hydrolase superfamily protein [Trifolium repens]
MRTVDLGLRTALIVTPVNVLHNWRTEFIKWAPSELKQLKVYMLEDVSRDRRAQLLAKWRAKGGVFLIGYAAFRNLSFGKNVKDRETAKEICHALQDGPDILVCDEAHIIKNTNAEVTHALKQVKCQRRIALTGSPLQNNLMEYYCMVDFVREGFLGSSHEFRNRFQNPIENGQHTNSTQTDVKIMNQRSHILYEQLKGFVQRMDMNVVKKDLPPKTVFVITVKLSPLQRKLYKRFLDVHGFTTVKENHEKLRKRSFFAGYQALARIWNHPGILQLTKEDKDCVRPEDAVENFLVDDISSDENSDSNVLAGEKLKYTNDLLQRKDGNGFFIKGWWKDILHEKIYKELDQSGKMVLLIDILTMSSDVGDKVLVFSQSIPTLDLIELYLSKLPRRGKRGKLWKKGKDWYRLDGRTESSQRQKLVERFNEPSNKRVKCTLISTRAGSLGINLHAANRVVIVDGSWNPTYDLQAIYRAWRYGQKKPVFAYRLLAHGTMEEKIYKRQVTKEGLAARVVDRQQVHRTISKEEMLHLFEFGDDENPETLAELSKYDGLTCEQNPILAGDSLKHTIPHSNGSSYSDKLMESLLGKHHPRWIANYHLHESLLQENEEERLSKEEQDMAWEVYRKSLEWEEVQRVPIGEAVPEQKPEESKAEESQEPEKWTLSTKLRNRFTKRQCTNLAHLLTLRSQGIKFGRSTVCGECARPIRWEDLKIK